MNKNNFYIITGGPGSGKTSILNELKNRGFLCEDEVARQIIQEQNKIGGDATHTKNQVKFCDLMLSRSIYKYELIQEKNTPVFFDRGIPDLIGYCNLVNIAIPDYLNNAVKLYSYNKHVFITPPWLEIYRHDDERKQSFDEAIKTYDCLSKAYQGADYKLIEIPKFSVEERVNFILKFIQTPQYYVSL